MTKSIEPSAEEKACRRVIAISRVNGWSVVVIAALGSLLALLLGDWSSLGIGVLIIGCGAMEVRGNRMLQRRNADGMRWLVRSQVFLLGLVLVYCATRLGSFDSELVMANLTPEMAAALEEAGLAREDVLPLVRLMFYALYGTVAVVTLVYQGGLALYYRSRTEKVGAALAV